MQLYTVCEKLRLIEIVIPTIVDRKVCNSTALPMTHYNIIITTSLIFFLPLSFGFLILLSLWAFVIMRHSPLPSALHGPALHSKAAIFYLKLFPFSFTAVRLQQITVSCESVGYICLAKVLDILELELEHTCMPNQGLA